MLCSIAIQSLVCSLHRNGCILGVVSPPAVRAGSSSQCVLHYLLRFRIRASKESLQWRSTHIVCPSVSVGTSRCISYFKICPLVRTLEYRWSFGFAFWSLSSHSGPISFHCSSDGMTVSPGRQCFVSATPSTRSVCDRAFFAFGNCVFCQVWSGPTFWCLRGGESADMLLSGEAAGW